MLYNQLAQLTFSLDCYISGSRALNIYDHENNTGDWHTLETWQADNRLSPAHVMGKNSPWGFDTSPYLGYAGIEVKDEVLFNMAAVQPFGKNIYAASHARAIADLVLLGTIKENNPKALIDQYFFDDMMPSDNDKQKVYDLLETALPNLSSNLATQINEWLDMTKEYQLEHA